MDLFVIYNNNIAYSSLREKIGEILYHGKHLNKLLDIAKVCEK